MCSQSVRRFALPLTHPSSNLPCCSPTHRVPPCSPLQTNLMALAAGGHSSRDFLRFGTPMQIVLVSWASTLLPPAVQLPVPAVDALPLPSLAPAHQVIPPLPTPPHLPIVQAVVSIISLIVHENWLFVWLITGLVSLVVFSIPQLVEIAGWWQEKKAKAAGKAVA